MKKGISFRISCIFNIAFSAEATNASKALWQSKGTYDAIRGSILTGNVYWNFFLRKIVDIFCLIRASNGNHVFLCKLRMSKERLIGFENLIRFPYNAMYYPVEEKQEVIFHGESVKFIFFK